MAVDMFLKMDDLKGESIDHKHKDAIDILSWSWGMSQSGTTYAGAGGSTGRVNVQDLAITHFVDRASPILMQLCASGRHIKSARISLRHPGTRAPYMVIDLEDVVISSLSTGGADASEKATEVVTLNFATVRLSYSRDGQRADSRFGWSIAENKAL